MNLPHAHKIDHSESDGRYINSERYSEILRAATNHANKTIPQVPQEIRTIQQVFALSDHYAPIDATSFSNIRQSLDTENWSTILRYYHNLVWIDRILGRR